MVEHSWEANVPVFAHIFDSNQTRRFVHVQIVSSRIAAFGGKITGNRKTVLVSSTHVSLDSISTYSITGTFIILFAT